MEYAERLKENLKKAEALVPLFKECVDDYGAFEKLFYEYIRLRYAIDDADFWSDDIRVLSQFSLEHQQALVGDGKSDLQDTSLNCAGATSAETKQILLLMKIRKDLNIDLSPSYIGTARSVSEIAHRVFAQL